MADLILVCNLGALVERTRGQQCIRPNIGHFQVSVAVGVEACDADGVIGDIGAPVQGAELINVDGIWLIARHECLNSGVERG